MSGASVLQVPNHICNGLICLLLCRQATQMGLEMGGGGEGRSESGK